MTPQDVIECVDRFRSILEDAFSILDDVAKYEIPEDAGFEILKERAINILARIDEIGGANFKGATMNARLVSQAPEMWELMGILLEYASETRRRAICLADRVVPNQMELDIAEDVIRRVSAIIKVVHG